MEPGLLVGDRLFVTKYSYGYSKHSFPFSPPIFENRIFSSKPQRGDVIVFKTPADNRTDYIKRLIGLPGDRIQFVDSNLYLNNSEIFYENIRNQSFFENQKLVIIQRVSDKILKLITQIINEYQYLQHELILLHLNLLQCLKKHPQ